MVRTSGGGVGKRNAETLPAIATIALHALLIRRRTVPAGVTSPKSCSEIAFDARLTAAIDPAIRMPNARCCDPSGPTMPAKAYAPRLNAVPMGARAAL